MFRKLFLLIALTVLYPSQATAEESLRIGPVYTDIPGKLSVVFYVSDSFRVPASDILLLEDGQGVVRATKVTKYVDSDRPLAWVLCVDVSGTMRGEPIVETKKALRAIIKNARPHDRLALVTFADEARVAASFDDTRDALKRAVSRLEHRGDYTVLYDALNDALDMLNDSALPKQRRIIVISDGKDEGSKISLERLIDIAQRKRIPVDGIGHGKIGPRFYQVLERIADATGGHFERSLTSRLANAADQIYARVMNRPIAHFPHTTRPEAPLTQSVGLRIGPPGSDSVVEKNIAYKIRRNSTPLAVDKEQKEQLSDTTVPFWLPIVLALLLASLAVALFFWRRQLRTPQRDVVVQGPMEPEPSSSEPIEASSLRETAPRSSEPEFQHPLSRKERKTQVGDYIPLPNAEAPAAILVGIGGPEKGRQYPVDSAYFNIGADPDNDLCVLHDEFVSGRHASIVFEGGNLFLVDHGSRNGSFVNEVKVGDTSVLLSFGDVIRLGGSDFRVDPGR